MVRNEELEQGATEENPPVLRPWLTEGLLMLGWASRGCQVFRRKRLEMRSNGIYLVEAFGAWIQFSIASTLVLVFALAVLTFGLNIDVPILIAATLAAIVSAFASFVVLGFSMLLGALDMTSWLDLLIVGVVLGVLFILGIPQDVLTEPLWSWYP